MEFPSSVSYSSAMEDQKPRDEGSPETEGGQHSRVRALVGVGAELAGGAAGGALGFLLAGPAGAAAAGAGGVAITRTLVAVGEEICDRLLSPREKARVGAALAIAASRTQERLETGDRVRDDGFLDDGTDRPPVEEVTEGLLMAAQRAYDEKKVPYIGRLSANLNFRPDLDVTAASVLVRLANELSYQQLCLLRLAWENQTGTALIGGKYKERFRNPAHAALISDFHELSLRGFINFGDKAVLGLIDVDPPTARPQAFGVHLVQLMELELIPEDDLAPLRAVLNAPDPVFVTVPVNTASNPFQAPNVTGALAGGGLDAPDRTVAVKLK